MSGAEADVLSFCGAAHMSGVKVIGSRVILLAASMMLGGCAAAYKQPEGKDTASLTLANKTPLVVAIMGYEVGEDCSGKHYNFNRLGRISSNDELNIRVKADKPFSFKFRYTNYTMSSRPTCEMPVTFTPKAGEQYVASLSVNSDRCYVNVTSVTASGPVVEPTHRLREFTPPIFGGSWCK